MTVPPSLFLQTPPVVLVKRRVPTEGCGAGRDLSACAALIGFFQVGDVRGQGDDLVAKGDNVFLRLDRECPQSFRMPSHLAKRRDAVSEGTQLGDPRRAPLVWPISRIEGAQGLEQRLHFIPQATHRGEDEARVIDDVRCRGDLPRVLPRQDLV
jgi:hypothetical protein